jgi:endoplasmic reticulum chaperone BiP
MARGHRRSASSNGFAYTTIFFYLLVLLCPLLLSSSARAEDQTPLGGDSKVTGPVIGIDLGTTYSCVGVMKNGKGTIPSKAFPTKPEANLLAVEILVNDQGNRITPSWVAFTDEERLVGDAAKNQFANNPGRTVFDVVSLHTIKL